MSLGLRQLFDYETWTYTYLLYDPVSSQALLIDAVKEQVERDLRLVRELGLELIWVCDTHVHADHLTAAGFIRERTKARSVISRESGVSCADHYVQEGDTLALGDYQVRVLSTPGHTNGCVSYWVEGRVFTGDALFVRGCGRTDFQQGSAEKLYHSIQEKLYTLPDETVVYPGHDYRGYSCSTIGEEKRFNPRIRPETSLEEFVTLMNSLKLPDPKRIHEAVPANLECGGK